MSEYLITHEDNNSLQPKEVEEQESEDVWKSFRHVLSRLFDLKTWEAKKDKNEGKVFNKWRLDSMFSYKKRVKSF